MTLGRPTLIVFAGVNGVGKTTFYKTNLWMRDDVPQRTVRVNPDELAAALPPDVVGDARQRAVAGNSRSRKQRGR